MEKEIIEFAKNIGAINPPIFNGLFKRSEHYYMLSVSDTSLGNNATDISTENYIIIVKISRVKKPFWGIENKYIDWAEKNKNFLFVLLTSSKAGYVYLIDEVIKKIRNGKWKLRIEDNHYKININTVIDDFRNHFSSEEDFKNKLRRLLKKN